MREAKKEMAGVHHFLQGLSAQDQVVRRIGDKPAGSSAGTLLPQDASLEAAQKAGLKSVKKVF